MEGGDWNLSQAVLVNVSHFPLCSTFHCNDRLNIGLLALGPFTTQQTPHSVYRLSGRYGHHRHRGTSLAYHWSSGRASHLIGTDRPQSQQRSSQSRALKVRTSKITRKKRLRKLLAWVVGSGVVTVRPGTTLALFNRIWVNRGADMGTCRRSAISSPAGLFLTVVLSQCLDLIGAFGQNQDTELTFLLPAGRMECFYQTASKNGSMEVEYQVKLSCLYVTGRNVLLCSERGGKHAMQGNASVINLIFSWGGESTLHCRTFLLVRADSACYLDKR